MADPVLVLCGGPSPADVPSRWRRLARLALDIGGGEDVHLAVSQLTHRMGATVPDAAMDLLEVATYVFAADQALTRGGTAGVDYGDAWRRRLRFVIPVRDPERWRRPEVQLALVAALEFLTDDQYEFAFVLAADPARPDRYLTDTVAPGGTEFEEVALFSGGLDSLCGAVEEVLVAGRRVALVSHRSATRVTGRQGALSAALAARAPDPRRRPLHVGVTVNKGSNLNREFTQRSRLFVFASVAAVVARQVGLDRVTFYENGCTSLNLPVSPELIGASASRTTHPQSLARIGTFFTHLFGTRFAVRNPCQLLTKAQMLERLRARDHADLCALTCRCGSVWARFKHHPHCGRCSQCVERRVSVLAAGLTDADDPPGRYTSDPLTGERTGPQLTFAERYVGTVRKVERIATARAFAVRYPEVNAALPYLPGTADEAARAVFELCVRNARGACGAIRRAFGDRAESLFQQEIPARSLLGVALERAAPLAPGPAPAVAQGPPVPGFVVDPGRFEVRLDGVPCGLGNTLDFRLVARLAEARGQYVTVQTIAAEVWADPRANKNSIQRVASSVRRQFRDHGYSGVVVDGDEDGYYRLVAPYPPAR
ncbi:winged helix-turn-helix domain-containing protein [Gemmata sp.]|uniref:winged helix-turn-helix domain-containing protein n=1 Tax=Gemmata sp. TaxID=1914242 RepID=UPI003F6F43F2